MRIAYLVSWFPAITETFILDEVRELRARGVEVEVLPLFGRRGGDVHAGWRGLESCTHYHRSLSWELLTAQVHWLRRKPGVLLRAWGEALRANASSRKLLVRAPAVLLKGALLARRIEGMDIQHVHAHWATHPTLAAWLVRALTGTGYSFTAHAHDLYVDRAMLREKADGARFVVTISEFNRRLLEGECGERIARKVHVIRCGVDVGAFAPVPHAVPAVPTFVCVASLREYKGHAVLLDALRLLRARGSSLKVVLVGDGELRGTLAARIARCCRASPLATGRWRGFRSRSWKRWRPASPWWRRACRGSRSSCGMARRGSSCRNGIPPRSPRRWSGSRRSRRSGRGSPMRGASRSARGSTAGATWRAWQRSSSDLLRRRCPAAAGHPSASRRPGPPPGGMPSGILRRARHRSRVRRPARGRRPCHLHAGKRLEATRSERPLALLGPARANQERRRTTCPFSVPPSCSSVLARASARSRSSR